MGTIIESDWENSRLKRELSLAQQEIAELKEILRHDCPSDSYRMRLSSGDYHYQRIFSHREKEAIAYIAVHMLREIDRAITAKAGGEQGADK